ncbi:hypothetical protein EJB05_03908 [Eragrostis curvula]|uniref:DNA replication checkpoint mediator MRC1 domain-containing protein n=1 Tax=Eragrostis curvula TaxID=38414 RepID=A0A5J9W964_9POAL|nr:hypothetical protein EJB05_03908 [Eragrostis curvula]
MDTEPFDEAELFALPASPVASPPRRLKRLKKSSSQTTTTTAINTTLIPPAGSPPPPPQSPAAAASPGEETLASRLSPLSKSSPPPPPPASDADALSPLPHSSPNPDSSPLPPTDSPDSESEEDDGFDPLFSESGPAAGWDPLGAPMDGDGGDEEEMLEGGLIEELRRETSAKKRLDMDEGEGEMAAGVEVKGKRSKRKRKEEAPKDAARGKKQSEKERRVQLESIHAESQRLLRETRSASFKPVVQPVFKPISSVLEKIRLRKLEIQKKKNTPVEDNDDDDATPEPASDSAGHLEVPRVKEVAADVNNLTDDVDKEFAAEDHDLDQGDSIQEDEDALNSKKDLDNRGTKTSNEEIFDSSQDNHDENVRSSENHSDLGDQTQLPPSSSPTNSTDDSSSEDEEEDNDKENIDPISQTNDANIHEPAQQATGDSCPDDALLKDFLDDEAEEEDDSDNDMMRFKDNEEDDGSDENEVFNDLIEVGYKEKEVDHKKRNELHQKWLEQQDAVETNNVMQKLKFGHKEQKEILDEDEDLEECGDESENEMSYDLTPTNILRQNSEKAKQMIAKMFTDDNDAYEHSDDDEIEENLARQRISKRESYNGSFVSPLEDDNSREVFGLIKKLNIAPPPKRRGKQSSSNHEMLVTGRTSSTSKASDLCLFIDKSGRYMHIIFCRYSTATSFRCPLPLHVVHHFIILLPSNDISMSPLQSSFLGRTASGSSVSSHRSVYRSYVFGRDDSNSSRSCMSTSESNSEIDQTNPNQPKKAKFSSSQPKATGSKTNSEGGTSSGLSLFEILRRSSSGKHEYSSQESCSTITESQAVHPFSAFKLSRRFSKVGARN